MLFVRFFFKSYLRRTSGPAKPERSGVVSKSSYEAVRGVEREVLKAMARDRGSAYNSTSNSDTENLSPAEPESQEETKPLKSKLGETVESVSQGTVKKATEAKEVVQERVQRVKEELSQSVDKLENFDDLSEATRDVISRVTQNTKEKAADLTNLTAAGTEKVVQEIREATSSVITKTTETFQWHDKTSKAEEESTPSTSEVKQESAEKSADEAKGENSASAYEASIDEATSKEEKEAEEKMQPDAVNEAKNG